MLKKVLKGRLVLGGTQRVDSGDGDELPVVMVIMVAMVMVMMVHYQVFDQLGAMAPHSLHSLQLKNCSQPIIMTNNDQ